MRLRRALTPHPDDSAAHYAAHLLQTLGLPMPAPHPDDELVLRAPADRWRESGLQALTGPAGGEGHILPSAIPHQADGVIAAIAALADIPVECLPDGAQLLVERAQLGGLRRQGRVACGGSCRLLETADGAIALNLARDDDWALIPAWLERDEVRDWAGIEAAVRGLHGAALVARGAELGLAIAQSRWPEAREWCQRSFVGTRANAGRSAPRVVDLSAMWAGPLCGRLLAELGAEVIKVEDPARPDGARRGSYSFFRRQNARKTTRWMPFTSEPAAREELRELIASADIVIESSRPRALRQLGLVAEELLATHPGLSWISISGYGRDGADGERVAFGDDAGVAAGLSAVLAEQLGEPAFVGDAIADPLTGMHAALAAWASWRHGGGELISLAMRDVVSHALGFDLPADAAARRERLAAWGAPTTAQVAA